MSILINDIEMPKNHNYVTITIWSNGAASYGLHDRGESLVDFRNVEVVSVPPHGRLIDADALLNRDADYEYPLFDTDGSWDCVVPCYDRETIKSALTVIEAEENNAAS